MAVTVPSAQAGRETLVRPSVSAIAADWLLAAIPPRVGSSPELDEIIHNLRTASKRARALVQLFGVALGKQTRRHEDSRLRDAARALAGARDSSIARTLLHQLKRTHKGRTAAAIASALLGLEDKSDVALTSEETRAAIARANATLHSTVRQLRRLNLTLGDACDAIEVGLRASYRRSRHQMRRAREKGTAAEFHEWRKLTKRVFYQLQFPGLAESKDGRKLVRQLDKLQERLGLEHDTHMVLALLRAEPARFGGAMPTLRVTAALESRAKKLRRRCLRLGAKAFSVKPESFAKDFRRRLRHLRARTNPA
ncbi:MAG: CHAD domain-containing protein [Limisphaerales bacterium]